jgi:bidirectional [NiFe] hydrogenase diaphorase subunit
MPESIRLQVDGKCFDVESGVNLLEACLARGIYIPHLCYLEDVKPPQASCRLCFVEIEGKQGPIPACTVTVDAPLSVTTDTSAVRRLQRTGLRLLLSVHRVDCKNCPANRRCELQRIARFLKVGLTAGKLARRLKEPEVDSSHPCLNYYPNRCVLCGKCVYICRSRPQDVVLSFVRRGFETVVGSYGQALNSSATTCKDCLACVDVCPVGALQTRP